MVNLDTLLEEVFDKVDNWPALEYLCNKCGAKFYYETDEAKYCPICGSEDVEVVAEVRILFERSVVK